MLILKNAFLISALIYLLVVFGVGLLLVSEALLFRFKSGKGPRQVPVS
jgi:hypothetical protein